MSRRICPSVGIALLVVAGIASAQQANHQSVTTVDQFAFDPPMLLVDEAASPLTAPLSLHSLPLPRTNIGFEGLSIHTTDDLWFAANQPVEGYLGLGDFAQSADTPAQTVAAGSRHLLVDLDRNRTLDALIAIRGEVALTVVPGRTSVSPPFLNESKRIDLNERVQDLAMDTGDPRLIAVLHDRSVRFASTPMRRPPILGSTDFVEQLTRRTPARVRLPTAGGRRIAGYGNRGTRLFAVLGESRGGLYVSLIEFDVRRARGRVRDTLGISEEQGRLRAVAIELADLDGDASPEAVVLATHDADNDNLPERGLLYVVDISLGLNLSLSNQGQVVVAPEFDLNAAGIEDCVETDLFREPTALRVADITGALGREPPDGVPDIVVAGNVNVPKCDFVRPFAQVWRVRDRLALAKAGDTVVTATAADAPLADSPSVTDLEVGRYNFDELPDIVLSDVASNGLILLKQQPRPCLTFITAITHGHQGRKSILSEVGRILPGVQDSGVDSVVYNDRHNARLSRRVDAMNVARRTPDRADGIPELCPVAHIAVNGHWEDLTSQGAFIHVLGRAVWLGGSFVPAPTCFDGAPLFVGPSPHPEPVGFWLSAFWLLVPAPVNPLDGPLCQDLQPNLASVLEFAIAGLGAATEFGGLLLSSSASEAAAVASNCTPEAKALNCTLDREVARARASMDPCTGQIALDALGFSRGAAVTSAAMQAIDIRPLRFNADASITYLDAIDPSWGPPTLPLPWALTVWFNGDSIRPWAKSGFFVGDPLVRTAGSARISSVFAGRPDGLISMLLPAANNAEILLTNLPGGLNIYRDVVGLPSGYDRSTALPVPAGGVFASALELTHTQVLDSLIRNSDAPLIEQPGSFDDTQSDSAEFSFANVTHMGPFLIKPRAQIPDFSGWRRDMATTSDDSAFLPTECPDSTSDAPGDGDDADGDDDGSQGANPDEFVIDPEFDVAHAIVDNARQIIDIVDALPSSHKEYQLPNLLPGDDQALFRDYIRRAAQIELPPGLPEGGWATRSAGYCAANTDACVRLRSDTLDEHRTGQFGSRLRATFDSAVIEDPNALEEAWKAATLTGQALDIDRINLYRQMLAGATRLDDAYASFPARTAKLNQVLLPASLAVRRLYVRVAYRMDEDDGELQLALNGQALNMTKAVPDAPTGERREYFFEVLRKAVAKDAQRDRLTLVGKNVSVFVVSVQAHKPWINPVNGRAYELVRFAGGSDWEAARAIAEKRVFDGAEGRLAQFDPSDTDAIDKLMEHYRPSTPIWLGASGSSSDQASFKWTDGSPMKLDRWHPGVKFPEKQKAPAFLYLRADGRLDHAPLTVSENGVPFGFFVEYGP